MLKLSELYDSIDESELMEWRALCLLDNWGRESHFVGTICSTIHNTAVWSNITSQSDRAKAWRKPSDFMPLVKFEGKKERAKKKHDDLTKRINDQLQRTMGAYFG